MKGSKTKESGRVDLFLRVPPALKKRIADAAGEEGVTLTDWVVSPLSWFWMIEMWQSGKMRETRLWKSR
jgi:hypothetical protein